MATYFRSDGFVKSAIGPAVSGAQVWVVLQPANLTVPPTPLADIFSDVNGLVPITQPILTDGFGHYDFYTLTGLYTVIVALGGRIQQVYPDQSIGYPSTSPSVPLQLQTNGANNGSQALLDLQQGSNITLTDSGLGQITISASGGGGGVSIYDQSGNVPKPANNHVATGTIQLSSGSKTVTLSAAAAFTTASAYTVVVSYLGIPGGTTGDLSASNTSGSSFTIHSTAGGDNNLVTWTVVGIAGSGT
jgi:hypothetical protein